MQLLPYNHYLHLADVSREPRIHLVDLLHCPYAPTVLCPVALATTSPKLVSTTLFFILQLEASFACSWQCDQESNSK